MYNTVCPWIVSLLLWHITGKACQTTANQQALHTHLFTSYDAGEKPYCGGAVNVTLDLALRQVIDLDEPLQILKANVWIRLKWQDCRLVWNSSQFGGIESFVVPVRYIWAPDITLYDGISPELVGFRDFRPSLHSDGTVSYNFPTLTESVCTLDVDRFPFDQQSCPLVFGSWVYDGTQMDLVNKSPAGDLSSAVEHVEWTYVSMCAERHVLQYNCCPEPYSDVTFYLTLRRKPKFYQNTLFVPSALITVMAVLGYHLPVESGEKVSLQITVMLSLAVFQQLVSDKLPPSADSTPLIAKYFNFSLYLVGMTCLMAVVVIAIHYQGNTRMPDWLYNIGIVRLSKITLVCVEHLNVVPAQIQNNNHMENCRKHKVCPEKNSYSDKLHIMEQSSKECYSIQSSDPVIKAPNVDYEEAWKKLATIVDRLCFFLFIVVCCTGICVFLYHFQVQM